MPLWWRLLGRLYAFALRLIPQEKQQTKADDRAGQMAADALDTYGNAVTLKGGNGAYSLAIWTDGSYAYSISVTDPLSRDVFGALLEENF